MKQLIVHILLCGLLATSVPLLVHADPKVTVVDGRIEHVSDDSIVVHNRRYYIAGAALLDNNNKPVKSTELRVGKKVEIFFHDKRIDSILIYPENWGE